ncbi:hypothetical protein F5Y16DRAFT_184455 [Xylariaceae sp. FL0255]|nr:hypothetical protein F5Y16DRAFT_184455 [Xylariaceae sp. FL0255]
MTPGKIRDPSIRVPIRCIGTQRITKESFRADALESADSGSSEHEPASASYYKKPLCGLELSLKDVVTGFGHLQEDDIADMMVQGHSEIIITSSLKDWDGRGAAREMHVGTLSLNGKYYEMTDVCVEPWAKAIPRVKWVKFENSSHMAQWTECGRFIQVCEKLLVG